MGKVYTIAVKTSEGILRFSDTFKNADEALLDYLERFGREARIQIQLDYYLYRDDKVGRDYLLSEAELGMGTWLGCREVRGPVQARTWMEAREKFGLPLTPEQQRLLAIQREFLL